MFVSAAQGLEVLGQQVFVARRQVAFERLFHVLDGQVGQGGEQRAHRHHVGQLLVADLLGDLVAGHEEGVNVLADRAAVDHRLVDDQRAARCERLLVLVEGRQVERHRQRGILDQRRADLLVRDDDGAIGRAAAHFRPVGGDPRHDPARVHGGIGQHLARKQHALSAETCDDDFLLHSAPSERRVVSRD